MTAEENGRAPRYKRRIRNYLLDVGLQLRYTAAIVIVAAFLTAGLGYKMYDATRETSRIIALTGQVDPTTAAVMQEQFAANDRVVLWGIVGFGVVLLVSVAAVGILITHKVAGPLLQISRVLTSIRDNRLGASVRALRKGDELQELHTVVREMHGALRSRAEEEARILGEVIASLEGAGSIRPGAVEELRKLRKRKEESLES